MSKTEILSWFMANNEAMSKEKIIFILLLSFCLGMCVFLTYRIAYNGVKYNARFNMGNVLIMMIASVIMMMISTNIAISLGMVGALSIVRFRTAIKDPQDIIYIFWSIAEGLCVGAQMNRLAIISTLIIAVLMVCFSFYSGVYSKYIVVVRGEKELDKDSILKSVETEFKKYSLRSVIDREKSSEMIIEVSFLGKLSAESLEKIKEIKGVQLVNWIKES